MTGPNDTRAQARAEARDELREWLRDVIDSFLEPKDVELSEAGVDELVGIVEAHLNHVARLRAVAAEASPALEGT